MHSLRSMNPVLLLIEDDRAQRELLSALLRDAGYLVVSASNALFARSALGTMRPAVIVTDSAVPSLSG